MTRHGYSRMSQRPEFLSTYAIGMFCVRYPEEPQRGGSCLLLTARIQHLTYFPNKRVRREGFLDERCARFQHSVMNNRVVRVA